MWQDQESIPKTSGMIERIIKYQLDYKGLDTVALVSKSTLPAYSHYKKKKKEYTATLNKKPGY